MARTIRVYWPNQVTGWNNFGWPGVIRFNSVVHISACQGAPLPPPEIATEPEDFIAKVRIRGDAFIGIRNVHPHEGAVEFLLEVLWDTPLHVVTDITVDDPAERGLIV